MLEVVGVIVQSITALAILFAGWQLLYHSRAMHRELEMAYVQRYWELMDGRSDRFVLTQQAEPLDDVVIARYLQLCEDELELRALGRVTDATWEFWSRAMFEQVNAPAYRAVLDSMPEHRFTYLRELLSAGPRHDPIRIGWLRRRLKGL